MRTYLPVQPPVLQHELTASNYRYREFLPSECLEAYVACYWTVDYCASNESQLHRILPDGCVDIIVDRRAASHSNGAFAVGLMTQYEAIALSEDQSLFGIRLYSDTACHFIRSPVSELNGHRVWLEDLWGHEALHLFEGINSSIAVSGMIEKVEEKLLQFLQLDGSPKDSLLQVSMQYMYASQGMIGIRSLADTLGYSERSIRRTFQRELGVSPKELTDIIRFQSLLQEMHMSAPSRFTDIALRYGYYDQPHFNHHFKHYYGLTPNQVFK
ncbi:helix-turn-helix transcriptional regulator [Paenibacillus mendelii]|uniref:DUF6597 domain-containing transcriptional factor n=1 Tax=Paenibacillus mendelii TaxID=206163 RepID=A0ABV6JKY3_9BACL|nr:helix-turn-helix transcriptional regulator [Paenibacillus mendelii]MCQ6560586.1 helix-turn-helix transcriptional regulator [Paenibacillus mendelii]